MANLKKHFWPFWIILACAPVWGEQIKETTSASTKILEGNELFDAGLYNEASLIYQSILEENSDSLLRFKASLHLGQALFAMKDYSQTIQVLSHSLAENSEIEEGLRLKVPDQTDQKSKIYKTTLYTLALAYSRSADYKKSIETLDLYLKTFPSSQTNEAEFELAQSLFFSKNYSEAKEKLKFLSKDQTNPRLYFLEQLYLSRIYLFEGESQKAAEILSELSKEFGLSDLSSTSKLDKSILNLEGGLAFELFYLRGETEFQQQNYNVALSFFQKALPKNQPDNYTWYPDTLYYIGWCYIRIGEDPLKNPQEKSEYFTKAERSFETLINIRDEEKDLLSLGQAYLIRGKELHENISYEKAEKILSQTEKFKSVEASAKALLLRAEAAPLYQTRALIYRQLTEQSDPGNSFYATSWYMRGLNDYEHALKLNDPAEKRQGMEEAFKSFEKAFLVLTENKSKDAASALKFLALATFYQDNQDSSLKAYHLISPLTTKENDLITGVLNQDEIWYLEGYFASHAASAADPLEKARLEMLAIDSLEKAASFPSAKFGDTALSHLGALHYKNSRFKESEAAYLKLMAQYPSSQLSGDALFWAACCSEKLNLENNIRQERLKRCFENYPLSTHADQAYFSYYTYSDYLQGDKSAIKHLQQFGKLYPNSPYLIEARYLIGLDYKRDRKTPEGKWIRRKSLTEAIDAFQDVEALFDRTYEKHLIPEDTLSYYINVRYRATLERALANLQIADESQGAKRQIYLEYAEEVFKSLSSEFEDPSNLYTASLKVNNPFPSIYEESLYWLAQTYIKGQNDIEAEKVFSKMLDQYKEEGASRIYYLSRVWDELGRIKLRKKEYALALNDFKQAEDTARPLKVLSTDQRLGLWIQESFCYRGLKQYDQAVLILSKVINDSAISSLRMKAMYLRAETYEEQGRHELARKQLESIVKKGGVWSKIAQEKLDKVSQ